MRNKILIIYAHAQERDQLEQFLQEIIEEGGELFFADKRENGIAIIKKEHPQLVFLDSLLAGEDAKAWMHEGVRIIFMRHKNEYHHKEEDVVFKPLKSHQVLEKCRVWLGREPVAQIPPM